MTIDEQEMIDTFKAAYSEESEIKDIKESVKNILKDFADKCEADPKIINAAYSHFRKIASGKNKSGELDAVSELNSIIDKYMSVE